MSKPKCDYDGDCKNQAYREADYFTNRKVRARVAERLKGMTKEEANKFLRPLFRTRDSAWSFLCRKHFQQERAAHRIIMWSRVQQ